MTHVPERDPTKAAIRMHQAILCRLPIWQAHKEALVIKRGANDAHLESNVFQPYCFCRQTRVINGWFHCSTHGQAHYTKVPVCNSVHGSTLTVCLHLPTVGHHQCQDRSGKAQFRAYGRGYGSPHSSLSC